MCAHVRKGKGGKEQYQRILDVETVNEIIKDVGEDDLIFSQDEMNNKIDLHVLRAENARNAYDYYIQRLSEDPEYRIKLRKELMTYFGMMNKTPIGERRRRFGAVLNDDKPIRLRGANKRRAEANKRPVVYDRLAVMAVSVFHLSHWRTDVTITNYLV